MFTVIKGLDFYVWIIPKGKYLIIGALEEHFQVLENLVDKVLSLVGLHVDIKKHPVAIRKHPITIPDIDSYDHLLFTLINRHARVIPAGEAAGLVTRNWGEGIYPALVSGEAAALNYYDPKKYVGSIRKLLSFMDERIVKAAKLYICSTICCRNHIGREYGEVGKYSGWPRIFWYLVHVNILYAHGL